MRGILFKSEVWKAKLRVLEQYGEAQTRRTGGLEFLSEYPGELEYKGLLPSDYCNELLKQMMKMASQRLICEYLRDSPLPFFQYFPYNVGSEAEVIETETIALGQEASNDNKQGKTDKKQREKITPKREANG